MDDLFQGTSSDPSALRNRISKGTVVAPGVFNGISALIAERHGFEALYLSGSGVAGGMGLPDLSLTSLTEVVEEVRRIKLVSRLPLIVDIDTGFGEILNVERTIREVERAGASAVHMEDQVLPKKCGHLEGKKLISADEMIEKVQAASKAKNDKNFMVIARTDARSVQGLDEAIERAKLYLKAGADGIFPEALESEDEFREFSEKVNGVLMANMTEFGKSPLLSVDELNKLGYKIVIFPLTAFRGVLKRMDEIYEDLAKKGTQRDFLGRIMSRKEYYDLINYSSFEMEDRNIKEKSKKITL
ncbi:MAG: methylisocitrate lyase [Candidatus Thermoplasmatota archaeon]|jgi:methylisocitrate lyase|nr:methylisocitrate lyase [Candidatus Thermoplasmatota archaeon]